ncbi:LOW QUALITY PROTEIN: NADP-dependent oxidoreductase domain-containing protein 1 [Pterocles gutturalis]
MGPFLEGQSGTKKGLLTSLADSHGLKVEIIVGGHLQKQLARALLTLSWPPCPSICVSTRHLESLADLQKQGHACFYDSAQLVAWADVAFLCCLPSQVLSLWSAVRPAIQKPYAVYSFVTTVPLLRLQQLRCRSAIVRPRCRCSARKPVDGVEGDSPSALRDPALPEVEALFWLRRKIRVNAEWLEDIFCAALNSSTWQSLPPQKALKLLSHLSSPECCPIHAELKTSCPPLVTFPWFDLIAAQLRSPFSQLLEASELVQGHLALLYQASFGDWPTKQCGLISTKTSFTSAVAEPCVTLDDNSFSTAASDIFSEIPEETAIYGSKSL